MDQSQFRLLATRRFLPIFATQALSAFGDNVLRNAIAILITYHLAVTLDLNAPLLVTLASALFIAPFFMFSALAGQLADKYEKGAMVRVIKLCEIAFTILASASLYTDSATLMLLALFVSGTLAAFFGPIKYGILPQHLQENELVAGNGMVETGTFLAILLGLLFGGLVITTEYGTEIVSAVLILTAVTSYLIALAIPVAPPPAPHLEVDHNLWSSTRAILSHARDNKLVFQSIVCISWFWALGAVFLAQFPAFTRLTLASDETVSNLLIAAFTVGIAIGSLMCNSLLKGAISARFAPIAGLGITIFALDLVWASSGLPTVTDTTPLLDLGEFVAQPFHWRILADLVGMALAGGVFVVPLYAIMQNASADAVRSRIVAAANVMNAIFMTIATAAAAAMLGLGVSIHGVFLAFALVNLVFTVSVIAIARRRPPPEMQG